MNFTPEMITLVILDLLFLGFGAIAWILSVRLALKWRGSATTALQYRLGKQSVLVAMIIEFIFTLKIPLFLFFIYTCDKLSGIIVGAMCASGVVNSVDFGFLVLIFKLFSLYLFGFWILLHRHDLSCETLPFSRLKFILFTLFGLILVSEIVLEVAFFIHLDISKIVSCCGTLFSTTTQSLLSSLVRMDSHLWLSGFFVSWFLMIMAYKKRNSYLFFSANTIFLFMALVSLITFFSPYIYELPTHRCPFCLLQKEYYYVGYFLYTALFLGTFYGISGALITLGIGQLKTKYWSYSLLFNSVYVIVICIYPISYFLKNGVWL